MTHEFRHPKFFKELRKRNKGAQAISEQAATAADKRSPGPGRTTLKKLVTKLNKENEPPGGWEGGPEGLKRSSSQASSGARINKRWI